jgi:anti-sigma factor RsiW
MCDFSGRLIAWLDRELPEGEASEVERHSRTCIECRGSLEAFQEASSTFDAFCDRAIAPEKPRRLPPWIAVAAVAAAAVLLATLSLRRVEKPPAYSPAAHSSTTKLPAAAAGSAATAELRPPPHSIETTRRRHAIAPVQAEAVNAVRAPVQNPVFLSGEPAIEISIPAAAMYPPGAVPEGVNFIADFTVAADGSAQPARLRPTLIGFERRASQP